MPGDTAVAPLHRALLLWRPKLRLHSGQPCASCRWGPAHILQILSTLSHSHIQPLCESGSLAPLWSVPADPASQASRGGSPRFLSRTVSLFAVSLIACSGTGCQVMKCTNLQSFPPAPKTQLHMGPGSLSRLLAFHCSQKGSGHTSPSAHITLIPHLPLLIRLCLYPSSSPGYGYY